ncbi:MAG: M23 family metallopeptidase [Bacteroidetes bacterium]|nr:M23 family metallopeptidase [Bacteroidota bacterium]
MKLRFLLGLCAFIWAYTGFSQGSYKPYFRYPLDSAVHLVSPFGSLRDNHFHSGIDLKTQEREGLPVYAAANGYISRIKVASNGYGRAIYIDHPNGFTTVYGHLQCYKGPIAQWILNHQYRIQSYNFDTVFKHPFIWVNKGDTIGLSGNSGGSTGPHLHYEIRETKTEEIWNPGLFGTFPNDSLKPKLYQLWAYSFLPDGNSPVLKIRVDESKLTKIPGDNFHVPEILVSPDTLKLPEDVYGFGLLAFDFIHKPRDEKGLYEYGLIYRGKKKFGFKLNRFAFSESKFINQHIDYPWYKLNGQRIQKLFRDDNNPFSGIETDKSKGKLFIKEGMLDSVQVFVGDVNDNYSYYQFYLQGLPANPKPREEYLFSKKDLPIWLPNSKNHFSIPGLKLESHSGTFYDTLYLNVETQARPKNALGPCFKVHESTTAIHKTFSIAIQADAELPFPEKAICLARVGKNNGLSYAGGTYKKGWVEGSQGSFGTFTVFYDTLAPTGKMLSYTRDSLPVFRWRIDDNFSGIGSYKIFLNGRWLAADFDAKNDLLIYAADHIYAEEKQAAQLGLQKNKPRWKLELNDNRGNTSVYEWETDW